MKTTSRLAAPGPRSRPDETRARTRSIVFESASESAGAAIRSGRLSLRAAGLALALLLATGPLVASPPRVPDPAVDAARAYRTAHEREILAEFLELLAIPNVAADRAGIAKNAEWIANALARRGVAAEIWTLPDANPVVYGRLTPANANRRIGIYVHYDGQPVDESQWVRPPWQPALLSAAIEKGGQGVALPAAGERLDPEARIYARSAGDDKAPLAALFTALDALAKNDLEPANEFVFLFEGEEEAGSTNLGRYFDTYGDELEADLWVICDGPVHQSRRPQLVFGVRGYTGFDLTVYGASSYLHSGHYGNWAPNPAHRLARLLAGMKNDDGKVLIEDFYDSTVPITQVDREALAKLPAYDDALRRELGLAASEADNAPLAERILLPSLNVRGMASAAVGTAARNVIPITATASVDIRLAKGNDPVVMLDLVERHLLSQGYHVLDHEPTRDERLQHPRIAHFVRRPGYPAVRTRLDDPAVMPIFRAATRAASEPPLAVPTLGGSLPLYLFTEKLEAPVVIAPIANHDNNQHAPNENLRLANLWYGVDLMAAILTEP